MNLANPQTSSSQSPTANRLLVIDGHAYAYRAFYAIRGLRSPSGEPTNAIYGFIKALAKARQQLQPAHLVVVWDGGLAAERTEALPQYKAQRPPMPHELEQQIAGIMDWLEAANVASHCQEGVEADDWAATLARHAVWHGLQVVIASPDKDFMQLVTDKVGLLNPNDKSAAVWTAEHVRAKTGVSPSQIVDWLSLIGDSVDNIPGVPGIGPKNALKLLQQFGAVTDLYERLDEVSPETMRASLLSAKDQVECNVRLIRLKDDLPCAFSPDELATRPAHDERLRELYGRWGFKTMIQELAPAPAQVRQIELFA